MAHVLFTLVAVLLLVNAVTADPQCTVRSSSRLQINVTSEMNEARQRFVTVVAEGTGTRSETLLLNVSHWAGLCGGTKTVRIELSAAEQPPFTEGSGNNSTTHSALACFPHYLQVPGVGCYKRNDTRLTWDDAVRSCEAEGAHLAVPDSRQELDALRKTVLAMAFNAWVGVRKVDGKWETLAGGMLHPAFTPGQSFGQEDCVVIIPSGLEEFPCNGTPSFICEQPWQ